MIEIAAPILVIGYGNPGRGDDGIGPAVAEALTARPVDGVTVHTSHQLQIEDALTVARHATVLFVDADASCPPPFALRPVAPIAEPGLLHHDVSPGEILGIAGGLFLAKVTGFALGVRGSRFEMFDESISPEGRANMEVACAALERILRTRTIEATPAPTDGAAVTKAPAP